MTQTPAPVRQPAPPAEPTAKPESRHGRFRVDVDVLFVPALILALVVALSFASPFFFTGRNVGQILLQGAVLGIVAVGATFVIIGGDLDLSIGFNVALSGIVTALVIVESGSWPLGVLVGLLCGMFIGLVNGVLSAMLGVPAFVATLGTGTVCA